MQSPMKMSLLGLFQALTGNTRTFIRQEIQLAKTEISEKISELGHNAVSLAIGGFIAYSGLIVLLIGLGWLLGWAFQQAGLAPLFAGFLGLTIIGLVVIVIGGVFLFKALKALSKGSLTPQKTIHTLQELRGTPETTSPPLKDEPRHAPSSDEIQTRVEMTENRLGETLDELGRRLSPQHLNAEMKRRIRANPYRSGFIAMGAGMFSALMLRRKTHHA